MRSGSGVPMGRGYPVGPRRKQVGAPLWRSRSTTWTAIAVTSSGGSAAGTVTSGWGRAPRSWPSTTRGIVLAVDTVTHSATLLRAFAHSPPFLSGNQGSMQVIDGGDYFVGWGRRGWVSEYDAAGHLRLDAQFAPDTDKQLPRRPAAVARAPGRAAARGGLHERRPDD